MLDVLQKAGGTIIETDSRTGQSVMLAVGAGKDKSRKAKLSLQDIYKKRRRSVQG